VVIAFLAFHRHRIQPSSGKFTQAWINTAFAEPAPMQRP
jgi:hypothetical protein